MSNARLFAPEVVQTSNMDCGPASLKSLLGGFGISASYGRLREACQTDVDGTSIDTIEAIAVQLGLDAEQVMLPSEHVLLAEGNALPALIVVRLPNGFTHFVVAWRKLGPFVQIMDPASGRRWMRAERFLSDLYVTGTPVPATAFEEWIASDAFVKPFCRRLAALGASDVGRALLDTVRGWSDRAALDAAVRFVESVVRSGGIRRGREAAELVRVMYEEARTKAIDAIAPSLWTATPGEPGDDGEETVNLRGAVLVRVAGRRTTDGEAAPALSPELVRTLDEPPPRPWRTLLSLLLGDGVGGAALLLALAASLVAAALGAVLEALLLRGAMSIGQELGIVQDRVVAVVGLLVLLVSLFLLELPSTWGASRLGRRLETRLLVAFLEKVPRLADRYFSSRPVSDMAERCHAGHRVRVVPDLARGALRTILEIGVTAGAIVWLDPGSLLWVVLAAAFAIAIPLVCVPALNERDMKMRTHEGAIARFYLDALLGLAAIRTHAAETSVRREHDALLVEWVHASRALVRAYVTADVVQSLAGTAVAVTTLLRYLDRVGDASSALLMAYWALALPSLGQELALAVRQLPAQRTTMLRAIEPLGAIEEEEHVSTEAQRDLVSTSEDGVGLEFEAMGVMSAGHRILEDVSLRVAPGEHVAVVGASGAGKSSLLGVLLGWHRPSAGRVLVDGALLAGEKRKQLRATTAWVDPAVHLWNRSLIDNLLYGAAADAPAHVGSAISASELASVLERLPDGMQTALGEGGGLVSGGEGQRVRLARALLRQRPRLVLLDEPFRGLERDRRHALLARARSWWSRATLLCVTHDVRDTAEFPRVLVIEGGRIVEDGVPAELLSRDSRYRAMVHAEDELARGAWDTAHWRRLRVDAGRVGEGAT